MFYTESEKDAVDNFVKEMTNKIVGSTVTSIEKTNYDTYLFTLNNKTQFKVTNYGECCASGEILDYTQIIKTDNIITSLKPVNKEEETGTDKKHFSIFLLSAMEEVIEIKGQVDEGTGYYSFGWELEIII